VSNPYTTDAILARFPGYAPCSYLPERLRARMVPPREAMPAPPVKQTALVWYDDGCGGNHTLHLMPPHVYHDVEVVSTNKGLALKGFSSPSRDAKGLAYFHGSRKDAHNGITAVLWSGWVTGDEPVVFGAPLALVGR
jgi:hypothetical protein